MRSTVRPSVVGLATLAILGLGTTATAGPRGSQGMTTRLPSGAMKCGVEHQSSCDFRGQAYVFYGANDSWTKKQLTDGTDCSNGVFGDPIQGVVKACYIPKQARTALVCGSKVKLKSWKGDYLHRPDGDPAVTSWSTGVGNEWTVECKGTNTVMLKSWKGDYLHRPDSNQGVGTWHTGIGNEWTVVVESGKVQLKSWKGDYLHRPDSSQGVTSWSTGVGNTWTVEVVSAPNS